MIKYYFESLDSTNNMAKKLLKIKFTNFAIIANEQTRGKKQPEIEFFTNENKGLYLSVAIKIKADLESSIVTEVAAVSVCKAIEALYGFTVDIKNYNDLFFDDKKVGRITVDIVQSFLSKKYFMIFGIELNLYKQYDKLSDQSIETAGYLFETKINKYKLANEIIKQIQGISKDFKSLKIKEEYERRSVEE